MHEFLLLNLRAEEIRGEAPTARADVSSLGLATRQSDGTFRLDSRGAVFFSRFVLKARAVPGLWKVPFDRAKPLSTPNTLAVELATAASFDKVNVTGAATLSRNVRVR